MTIEKHTFSGSLIACKTCFKPAKDPIHETTSVLPANLSTNLESINIHHTHDCPVCKRSFVHKDEICVLPQTTVCETCKNPEVLDTLEQSRCSSILDLAISTHEREENINHSCAGHVCVKCSKLWRHDYVCNIVNDKKNSVSSLCRDCAQQTAAIINRPANLEMIKNYETLSPADAVQLGLEHDRFIVNNLTKDREGKDLPDKEKIDNIMKHIQNLRNMMERLKIKADRSYNKLAEVQMEECTKFTPEEREEFIKLAKKNKQRDDIDSIAKKEKKRISKEEYQKQLDDILKKLGKGPIKLDDFA